MVHFIGGSLTASESDGELEVALIVENLEGIPLNLTFTFEPAQGQGGSEASYIAIGIYG